MTVDEAALNHKIGRLKSEMSFLAEEIEAIGQDAKDQPEKYGPAALEELRHSYIGEILRLRAELDGIESALLAVKETL